jgi:DNA ligase-1
MYHIEEPILAGKITDKNIDELEYPGLVSYKLDGIRCLIVKGKAVSRNFKPIRNDYIRNIIEEEALEGFDGEIITGENFQDVASGVMSKEGKPDFTYMVFDYVIDKEEPYYLRMKRLSKTPRGKHIRYLLPTKVNNLEELLAFEKESLDKNYEGVMWRSPDSPYFYGRSSFKKAYLLKLKRFSDAEAEIVGFTEQIDKHGKPKDTLGSLIVLDLKNRVKFNVGSGLDDNIRNKIWNNKKKYLGKIITYRSQSLGTKVAPRFPTFVKIRDEADMDKGFRWKT